MQRTIRNFRHKGIKRLYQVNDRRGVPPDQVRRLQSGLAALQMASNPGDLEYMPGAQLHRLSGNWSGFWSLRVNGNWRLVFRFEDGHVCDLDLVDYH